MNTYAIDVVRHYRDADGYKRSKYLPTFYVEASSEGEAKRKALNIAGSLAPNLQRVAIYAVEV